MPKYYCDYCDTYLTHDSPSVRKTHCTGRKHKDNVKFYYQKWMEEQAQNLIDATTAAFKAGKIANNPFAQAGKGGVAIPPPAQMAMGQRPGGPGGPGMIPSGGMLIDSYFKLLIKVQNKHYPAFSQVSYANIYQVLPFGA